MLHPQPHVHLQICVYPCWIRVFCIKLEQSCVLTSNIYWEQRVHWWIKVGDSQCRFVPCILPPSHKTCNLLCTTLIPCPLGAQMDLSSHSSEVTTRLYLHISADVCWGWHPFPPAVVCTASTQSPGRVRDVHFPASWHKGERPRQPWVWICHGNNWSEV